MHTENFIISTFIDDKSYVENVQSNDWVEISDDMDAVVVGDVKLGPDQPQCQQRSQSGEAGIHLGHHSSSKAGKISGRRTD